MNVYEKLQAARAELQTLEIKKSGKNTFAKYEYYELDDIMPPITLVCNKLKLCSWITFGNYGEPAILRIVDSENPETVIEFHSPMVESSVKGANEIQNLGAVETYQRRYLYMNAFEITEKDWNEVMTNAEEKKKETAKASAEKEKLKEVKSEILEISQSLIKSKGRDVVMGVITKYAPNGNPNGIKDINKLNELVNELKSL